MDIISFNIQAERLCKASKLFPNIDIFWNPPFLKLNLHKNIDWEICVLYSHAYSCPVLYFRNRTEYLTTDQLFTYIVSYKEFISSEELPLTGEPYYMLHPCNTQNLLICNITAWLSVVLQTLGISLPIQLYLEFNKINTDQ